MAHGGHNGAAVCFGNDGLLYLSTGDAEVPAPPDPRVTGQDITDLLSSVLRIDVDHADRRQSVCRAEGQSLPQHAQSAARDLCSLVCAILGK